jgi:hypothetical protein
MSRISVSHIAAAAAKAEENRKVAADAKSEEEKRATAAAGADAKLEEDRRVAAEETRRQEVPEVDLSALADLVLERVRARVPPPPPFVPPAPTPLRPAPPAYTPPRTALPSAYSHTLRRRRQTSAHTCRNFVLGNCPNGTRCQFYHDYVLLRNMPQGGGPSHPGVDVHRVMDFLNQFSRR